MKLTIAVLTYNRADYLGTMLDSIKHQTCTDFIVKIYDNASTDNTYDIVQEYLKDERFLYFRNKENIGASNNGNRAITECTTEYLSITHDDDIMHPDMIREELSILENNNQVNLVCVNCDLIDIHGNIVKRNTITPLIGPSNVNIGKREYIMYYIKGMNIISCPTVMLRMSVITENKLEFRNGVGKANDTYFWLELNMVDGFFSYISRSLYYYRVHGGQDSQNTIFMIPMLKKPVYLLLKKNGFSRILLNKWREFVNAFIYGEIFSGKYNRKVLGSIKNNVLLLNTRDIWFGIIYISLIHFPRVIKKLRRMLKKRGYVL